MGLMLEVTADCGSPFLPLRPIAVGSGPDSARASEGISMNERKSPLGWIGIAAGSVALILALLHFYAGPFSPQPTLEQAVAEKAVAIKDATIAALKGETVEPKPEQRRFDADRMTQVSVAVLGGLAIVLAAIGFALKEPYRVAIGAAGLGAAAVSFQFLAVALGAIVFVVLVAAVLMGPLDFDFG